jgi:hypothetical protein
MTVVRMKDPRLVIFSAISLDKAGIRALEDYGPPAFLVVPNDHHRLDARAWKDRYPDIQVVAPEESGFGGWFLRKVGFAGNEPQIPKPVKLTMISNKDELRHQLLRWADIPMLKRILVSHGAVIEERASETLRELATSLE